MASPTKHDAELVDLFVARINAEDREHLTLDQVPPSLRLTEDEHGRFDWNIVRSNRVDWIDELLECIGNEFPPTFLSLVSRYEFPVFEFGPVVFLANTAEPIDLYDLRKSICSAHKLERFLISSDLIPFAKPSDWQYDPVCFDARKSTKHREYPIVRVDHEEVLLRDRIRVVAEIAPSFRSMLSHFVGVAI